MSNHFSERKALLLLLLVSFVWGAGFFLTDIALRGFTTFQILTIRFFIGAVILSIAFKSKLNLISKFEIKAGIYSGALLAVAFAIQVYGQYYSTPAISAFITVSYVVMVPIFSKIIFKKSISKSVVLSAILILIGILVITLGTFNKDSEAINMILGIVLTGICAVAYTFQVLIVDYYSHSKVHNIHPTHLTICMIWTAFFVSLMFAIFSFFVFDEKIVYSSDTLNAFISIIFLGMFSTAFAFLAQNFAQKHASASKVAIILSLESVFGAFLSALVLKESFNVLMIIGFVIVFMAVIITELSPVSSDAE